MLLLVIMDKRKKKPIVSLKKIQKSASDITQVDANTYYVKSSDPEKEPYFVYNSINIGWTCDCMDFTMNITDTATKECKHIFRCRLMGK